VPAIVAAIAIGFGQPFSKDATSLAIGILGALLIFDLTVCAYVLIKWQLAGVPPDLWCELLMITPEEREVHRNFRARPKLDDDAFYQTFYAESDVPKHSAVKLRALLEDETGYDLAGLHPSDNLVYLDSELDFADVFFRIERDFKIKLDWGELQRIELTFDSLLRATLRCMAASEVAHGSGATITDA
jgi:hypothetical protein